MATCHVRTKHTPTPRTVQRPTGSHLALSGKPSASLSTLKQGHSMGCRLDGINLIHVQPVPPEVEMTHALVCLLGVGTTAFFYICIVSYHSCFLISYPGSHRLPPVPQWSPQVDLQTPHTHTESHHGIVLADSRVKILGVCSSPISLSRGVGPCVQPNTHPIPRVSETLVLSLAAASAAQEQTHVKHQVHSYLP